MVWLRTVFRELYGLFVDDGSFALAVVVWLVAAWFVLTQLDPRALWAGPLLFAGLAVILVESVWRRARR